MPEIPDRVPGGVILASYANDIRDRTVQRYASAVERDSLTPLPAEGAMAYLIDQDALQVFAGGLWRDLAQGYQYLPLAGGTMTGIVNMGSNRISGLGVQSQPSDAARKDYVDGINSALDARLDALEAIRDAYTSTYTEASTGLSTTLSNITNQLTAASDGTYIVELNCLALAKTTNETTQGGILFAVDKNGVQQESWGLSAGRQPSPEQLTVEWPVNLVWALGLAAGDTVQWKANLQGVFTDSASVEHRRSILRRVT